MAERITVEQNGERFTLEVPDGTTDDEIKSFLQGQQQTGAGKMFTAEPSLQEPLTDIGAVAAARPVGQFAATQAVDLYKLGKIAAQVTPRTLGEFVSTPITSTKNLIAAYLEGHPYAAKLANEPMAKSALRGIAGLALSPETILAAPYMMTGYEMEKIRANPEAYPNVPYAQVVRGEQPTIGAAGAANVRDVIGRLGTQDIPVTGPVKPPSYLPQSIQQLGQQAMTAAQSRAQSRAAQSGYIPTPQEAENILASGDERMMRIYGGRDALTEMVRRKAAQKVLAQ